MLPGSPRQHAVLACPCYGPLCPMAMVASAAKALVGERLLLGRQRRVEVLRQARQPLEVFPLLLRELSQTLNALGRGRTRVSGRSFAHLVVQRLHFARVLLDLLGVRVPRGFLGRGDLQVGLEAGEPLVGGRDRVMGMAVA